MTDEKKTLLASIIEKVVNADEAQRGMILAYAQGLAEGERIAETKKKKETKEVGNDGDEQND